MPWKPSKYPGGSAGCLVTEALLHLPGTRTHTHTRAPPHSNALVYLFSSNILIAFSQKTVRTEEEFPPGCTFSSNCDYIEQMQGDGSQSRSQRVFCCFYDLGNIKFMLSPGFCNHKKIIAKEARFKCSFQRGGTRGRVRGCWALLLHPAGQDEGPQLPQPAAQPDGWSRGRGGALRSPKNQLPSGSTHRPRWTVGWVTQLRGLPGRCGRGGHHPGSAGVFQTQTEPTAGARLQRAAEEHLRLPQDFRAGGHLEAEGAIPISWHQESFAVLSTILKLHQSVYLISITCYFKQN